MPHDNPEIDGWLASLYGVADVTARAEALMHENFDGRGMLADPQRYRAGMDELCRLIDAQDNWADLDGVLAHLYYTHFMIEMPEFVWEGAARVLLRVSSFGFRREKVYGMRQSFHGAGLRVLKRVLQDYFQGEAGLEVSLLEGGEALVPSPKFLLSKGQKRAVERLVDLVEAVTLPSDVELPFDFPRNVLVVGPRGSGKDVVIQEALSRLSVPVLKLNPGSWVLSGSTGRPTLRVVRDFLRMNRRGCIVLERLDSLRDTGTDWNHCVLQEIRMLLEGRHWSSGEQASEEDERLDVPQDFAMLATATFASLWGQREHHEPNETDDLRAMEIWKYSDREPITDPEAILDYVESGRDLLADLSQMFSPEVVIVPPVSLEDSKDLISRIERSLPKEWRDDDPESLAKDMVASSRGMRWLSYHYAMRSASIRRIGNLLENAATMPPPGETKEKKSASKKQSRPSRSRKK